MGTGRRLVGLKPRVVHSYGGREGPERRQRRRLAAEHRLEERPARRRSEAVHQKRDASEVAADSVVLLPREAGEVLTTHLPRFERRKVRMATDLLLYGVNSRLSSSTNRWALVRSGFRAADPFTAHPSRGPRPA